MIEKGIALEVIIQSRITHGMSKRFVLQVSPISNQMLRVVDNLQDHAAVDLLNAGVPISINSDDPTVYGMACTT